MKAFTYTKSHTLNQFSVTLQEVPDPVLKPQDVLVRVKAFSFNPVDYKIRTRRSAEAGGRIILGWDAAGVIERIGVDVKGFTIGDEVYYAGEVGRDGSYAELQAVDHRLIAKKPTSLSYAHAAALPLTSLTAWEALFERGMEYTKDSNVLIIGGAGGVGSMAIQLLKHYTDATVIATATRPDTISWCNHMGADHVIGRNLEHELNALGIGPLDVIFSTTHTQDYLAVIPSLLRPFGSLCVIDDPGVLDIQTFKQKALSVHWEFMFAKAMHGYRVDTQGAFLKKLADAVDAGHIKSTFNLSLPVSNDALKQAHTLLEEGKAFGKIVMEWE